jgi:predicted sugar kinase
VKLRVARLNNCVNFISETTMNNKESLSEFQKKIVMQFIAAMVNKGLNNFDQPVSQMWEDMMRTIERGAIDPEIRKKYW